MGFDPSALHNPVAVFPARQAPLEGVAWVTEIDGRHRLASAGRLAHPAAGSVCPLPSAHPDITGLEVEGRVSVHRSLSAAPAERMAPNPGPIQHALPVEKTACLQALNYIPADRPALPRPGSQRRPFTRNMVCLPDRLLVNPERNFHHAGRQRGTQEIEGSIKRSSHWGGRGREDSSPPCRTEKGKAGRGKSKPSPSQNPQARAQQECNKAVLVTMKSKPCSPSPALPLCKMGR